ncbi:MAG: fused MFS/spermidine synthase [Bacteroidia bacterium]|nr:fused MFS/spermidine synthase [Bacteroidia bacterium]
MNTRLLYFLCFLEGAAVMAAELLGAKMLAPHFGSSLHVWATVMAVTLGGLAGGYFAGGLLSARKNDTQPLMVVLLIGSAFISLMPFLSTTMTYIFGNLPLTPAILICTLTFLFPPVFMMGMVSPLLVGLLSKESSSPGKVAGTVYATSTVGGILATFLTGFIIIPHFGLTGPAVVTGIILGLIPLLFLIRSFTGGVIIWVGIAGWCIYKMIAPPLQPGIPVPFFSEGLMGQIMVVDYPMSDSGGRFLGFNRTLYVNRMTQAQLSPLEDEHYYAYVPLVVSLLESRKPGSSVLVCGMGGGGLANELTKNGYDVEVCEIDPRITQVAQKYFQLDAGVNVVIDDARHHIRTSGKKYDAIILDIFKGEEIPGHCFTAEAFREIYNALEDLGVLIINGNGYYKGEGGRGNRSIYRTLLASGYDVRLFPTALEEDWSNIEFFAVKHGNASISIQHEWQSMEIFPSFSEIKDAVLLTDNRPILDILNREAYRKWRYLSIGYFNGEMQRGRYFPVFQ